MERLCLREATRAIMFMDAGRRGMVAWRMRGERSAPHRLALGSGGF